MWILSWTKYSLSKFATFVSVIGALTRYAGAMCLFSGLFLPAIICFAIGIGIHYCAEAIAKKKTNKAAGAANGARAANPANNTAKSAPSQQNSRTANPNPNPEKNASSATAQSAANSDDKVKCSECGALVSATCKFCNNCGSSMVARPKPKKCLRCGAIAENGKSKFCSECGYELK